MPKHNKTFSLKTLLFMLALASLVTFYFTYERRAELALPAAHYDCLLDHSELKAAVDSIPENERPHMLRGPNPDYQWVEQNLLVVNDEAASEATLSFATNRATSKQLLRLLEEISLYAFRFETSASSGFQDWDSLDYKMSLIKESVDAVMNAPDAFNANGTGD